MPLKYLSNFWKTLEMPLISCKINLILTWSKVCIISSVAGAAKFKITDTSFYVPMVTLSTQDSANLLEQLRSGFKRKIYWNEYQLKFSTEKGNQYLGFLIDSGFQGVR